MLLLFSVFLIVAGKVGVDFIISDIFKACVLELGFIGEGVAAVALIPVSYTHLTLPTKA